MSKNEAESQAKEKTDKEEKESMEEKNLIEEEKEDKETISLEEKTNVKKDDDKASKKKRKKKKLDKQKKSKKRENDQTEESLKTDQTSQLGSETKDILIPTIESKVKLEIGVRADIKEEITIEKKNHLENKISFLDTYTVDEEPSKVDARNISSLNADITEEFDLEKRILALQEKRNTLNQKKKQERLANEARVVRKQKVAEEKMKEKEKKEKEAKRATEQFTRKNQRNETPAKEEEEEGKNQSEEAEDESIEYEHLAASFDSDKVVNIEANEFYGIVAVSYKFKNLKAINESVRHAAVDVHAAIDDSKLAGYNRKYSRLLINPSVVEFIDSIENIQKNASKESVFFLCLISHGLSISSGENAGSYIAFPETRISSVDELLITSLSQKQLAELIHGIPCIRKFIALEVCQSQNIIREGAAPTIKGRAQADLLKKLYNVCLDLRVNELRQTIKEDIQMDETSSSKDTENNMQSKILETKVSTSSMDEISTISSMSIKKSEKEKTFSEISSNSSKKEKSVLASTYSISKVKQDPYLFYTIFFHSCRIRDEIPLKDLKGGSNFIRRLSDAFRGGAVSQGKVDRFGNWTEDDMKFPYLYATDIICYINKYLPLDIKEQLESRKKNDNRRKSRFEEHSNPYVVLQQNPELIGIISGYDFPIGYVPKPPTKPNPPHVISTSRSTIKLQWEHLENYTGAAIIGYQIQRKGSGRACQDWRLCGKKQVLSYENIVKRNKKLQTYLEVRGLTPDSAYSFRVIARNNGGWGDPSDSSVTGRTIGMVKSYYFRDNIQIAFEKNGAIEVVKMMIRSPHTGILQRLCIEQLSKLALTVNRNYKGCMEVVEADGLVYTIKAMKNFDMDFYIQQFGALLIGRLAQVDELRSLIKAMPINVKKVLQHNLENYSISNYPELYRMTTWALDCMKKKQRKEKSQNE